MDATLQASQSAHMKPPVDGSVNEKMVNIPISQMQNVRSFSHPNEKNDHRHRQSNFSLSSLSFHPGALVNANMFGVNTGHTEASGRPQREPSTVQHLSGCRSVIKLYSDSWPVCNCVLCMRANGSRMYNVLCHHKI